MNVSDIVGYSTYFICNSDEISIFAILNSIKDFEAILVNMVGNKHYFISLVDRKLDEEKDIPLEDLDTINIYIDSIGGKGYLFKEIKELYSRFKEFNK